VTVRDLTHGRGRLASLLDTIDSLRLQKDQCEAAARTAAHDVRSSLAALTGFIRLALLQPDRISAEASGHLSQALQIGKQIHAQLDVVLHGARHLEPQPERVELGPMGQRLFTALRAAYPEVSFTCCVDTTDQTVRAPPAVVWGVLWNLLVNALKYRRADRVLHIELRAWREGPEVCVEVRDNGRGIPPGEREKVFARGRRGSNALDVEGTGLGLYSARRGLDTWEGRIWVEPSGEGSILRVALPTGVL
jgi:signal transduction histidine kinase